MDVKRSSVGSVIGLLLPGVAFAGLFVVLEPLQFADSLLGMAGWAIAYAALVAIAVARRRAAALAAEGERGVEAFSAKRPFLIGACLVATDQLAKVAVRTLTPLRQTVEIIPGMLDFHHTHNPFGSWIGSMLGFQVVPRFVLSGIALFSAAIGAAIYRYAVFRRQTQGERERGLPDMYWLSRAGVLLVSGLACAFLDLTLWGYTVDYVGVAKFVVVDLKDVLIVSGVALLLAEVCENPRVYWRMKTGEAIRLVVAAVRYSSGGVRQVIRRFRPGEEKG